MPSEDPHERDRAAIDAVVAAYYAAFDNRDGRVPTLADAMRALHRDARIQRVGAEGLESWTPHAFAAPRVAWLTDGTLRDFHEWETAATTEIAGHLATRLSRYAKAGLRDGAPFAGSGTKSFHLVRQGLRWCVASVLWQDDAG